MKIAILYSGAIRTLAETINNNLDYFYNVADDIDLYFSVWDHVGYANHLNSPDYISSQRLIGQDSIVTEKLIKNLIPNNIIKKIKIEKYNYNNYQLDLLNNVNPNLAAQYYKILDCCNLLDRSVNYDAIIRMRCDVLLHNKIDKKLFQQLIKHNKIIFPNKVWFDFIKSNEVTSINEMVWISNIGSMKKTCNIYNNSHKINKIIHKRKQTISNYGENICYMNLEVEELVNNIYLHDFNYQVLR